MKKVPRLKPKPTLKDFQNYVKEMVEARGFSDESPKDMFVLLVEEVGELARAIRKTQGIKMADDTKRAEMEDEFADCLIYLIDLANHYKINLEKAFRTKEKKNSKRVWK